MISVVVCTYNRGDLLPELLKSLRALALPPEGAEFIFVDNGSTDGSLRILTDAVASFPAPAHVLQERRAGVSNARNRGWSAAVGEYVLFLDDDALPPADWLRWYSDALRKWQPAVAGGPIEPLFAARPPRWLNTEPCEFNRYFGRFERPKRIHWLRNIEQGHGVWGGNMAVRREVLAKINGFDPDLGVSRKNRSGGSDTELQLRIARELQGRVLYVPEAVVQHLVTKQKMRIGCFIKQHFHRGISSNQLWNHVYWRTALKGTVRHGLKTMWALLGGDAQKAALCGAKTAMAYGHLVDSLHTRLRDNPGLHPASSAASSLSSSGVSKSS